MFKLEPIDGGASLTAALDLLAQGFPERDPSFWRLGFKRAAGYAETSGVPVGQLLISKGEPSGLILTFGSRRPGRALPVVNLSAWYVREAKRFLAPTMLKSVTSGPETFTDLTPTPQAARVSHSVGFRAMTNFTAIVPIAAAILAPPGDVRVAPWRQLALSSDFAAMAEAHEAMGCVVIGLRSPGKDSVVIARRRRYLRLPSLEILYAQRDLLRSALGPMARHVALSGVMFVTYDCESRGDASPLSFVRKPHTQRLIKGDGFADCIDYAWSELAILNP